MKRRKKTAQQMYPFQLFVSKWQFLDTVKNLFFFIQYLKSPHTYFLSPLHTVEEKSAGVDEFLLFFFFLFFLGGGGGGYMNLSSNDCLKKIKDLNMLVQLLVN